MNQCANNADAEDAKCPPHTFSLQSISTSAHFKRPIEACFCPINIENHANKVQIIPRFLNDGLFYTPAFVLDLEKEDIEKKVRHLHSAHIEKVRKETDRKTELQRLPRPYSGRKFCYICRESYTDYLQHTNHKFHLHRLRTNRYRNMITHLCRDFYPINFVEKSKRKKQKNGKDGKQPKGEKGAQNVHQKDRKLEEALVERPEVPQFFVETPRTRRRLSFISRMSSISEMVEDDFR